MTISPTSQYHAVVSRILNLLDTNKCWYETFEHEPVRTSEEAAKVRHGYTLHQGAKALIVRVKVTSLDKRFVMLVTPGDARFNSSKVKALLGVKDIRLATEDEVADITRGVKPGGVPPFGNLFDLDTVVDPDLLTNDRIIFNAGDRSFSVGVYPKDYLLLVKPTVASIT